MAESPSSRSSWTEGVKVKRRVSRGRALRCPRLWMLLWGTAMWLVALRIYWSTSGEPRRASRGREGLREKMPQFESRRMKVGSAETRNTEVSIHEESRGLVADGSEGRETFLKERAGGGASAGSGNPPPLPEGSPQMSKAELARWFRKGPPLDPRNATGGDWARHFYPGRIWLDTEGNPIQAHGGGMLYNAETKTFYWYGEIKRGNTTSRLSGVPARVDIVGVGCYSSRDLWAWKNEGIALRAMPDKPRSDLHPSRVLERPKVIYNDRTRTYVMWMHIDNADYKKAAVGVAISDRPEGPFTYLRSRRPHKSESRDMTLFKDDDGQAYLIYSSEDNSVLHIGKLTPDYLDLQGPMVRDLIQQKREAPAVFKFKNLYYMVTSGCSGWMPNSAEIHVAASMMGPWYSAGNPCIGPDASLPLKTFMSQGTFVLPLPGSPSTFIFMADRWKEWDLQDSRYVWLPLTVIEPLPNALSAAMDVLPTVVIEWFDRWQLPYGAFAAE